VSRAGVVAVVVVLAIVVFGWSESDRRPWFTPPCEEATCMPWTTAPTFAVPSPPAGAR
jgi:hypothetical protein